MALDIQQVRSFLSTRSRFGRLWKWGRTPKTIPIVLRAPEALSTVDALLALYPSMSRNQAVECRMDLLRNGQFFEEVNRLLVEKRRYRTNCEGWHEFLYMVVRCAKPKVFIETGVFDGLSSSVILQALYDNNIGHLVSVDLPATEAIKGSTDGMTNTSLPPGALPGWVVPQYLRQRYRLLLGDSHELLPKLLEEYPSIDIFFHDSLHTFKHQYFEYTTAWPHLTEGGLLLSDDIFWNAAFDQFCKEEGKRYIHVDGFGAIRK